MEQGGLVEQVLEYGGSPAAEVVLGDMGVLAAYPCDVLGVPLRVGRQHRQVGVAQHATGEVPVGRPVHAGEPDQPSHLVGGRRIHAHEGQPGLGQLRGALLVVLASRVDGVVEPRGQQYRSAVLRALVSFDGLEEVRAVREYLLKVTHVVVAAGGVGVGGGQLVAELVGRAGQGPQIQYGRARHRPQCGALLVWRTGRHCGRPALSTSLDPGIETVGGADYISVYVRYGDRRSRGVPQG